MKYAIISDIHGNMPALKLVLEDAKQQGIDGYLFAGDYCISAPWFNEVITCIRSLPNTRIICGNEERYLHLPDGEDAQFAVSRWAGRSMSKENIAWVDKLPERLDWSVEGFALHMAHQSPAFMGDAEFRLAHCAELALHYSSFIAHGRLVSDVQEALAKDASFQQQLSTLASGVYLFGHTHVQWHAAFSDRLFINPGSCGLPLDCGELCAPYTLLTLENGCWKVEERRIPYDCSTLIEAVRCSDQYKAAPVWCEVIFLEWQTRREKVMYFLKHVEQYAKKIGDDRRPFMTETWQAGFEDWMANGKKP